MQRAAVIMQVFDDISNTIKPSGSEHSVNDTQVLQVIGIDLMVDGFVYYRHSSYVSLDDITVGSDVDIFKTCG